MGHKAYDPMVWSGLALLFLTSVQQDLNTWEHPPSTGVEWYGLVVKYALFGVTAFQTAWARNKTPKGGE